MEKRDTIAIFLGVMLLLLPLLSVVPSVVASSSQALGYRFDAKWGIGPPEEKPRPPKRKAAVRYELFIEIDYMPEHKPNQTILAYISNYYLDLGINVTFYVDDPLGYSDIVDDPTPDTNITASDFQTLNSEWNDHDEGYFSKWKWVLFGTWVEGEPNTAGYAHVILSVKYVPPTGRILSIDCLAGNYIFVADETGDSWALSVGIEPYGAEAVVLMHELGHSIGIMNVGWSGNWYTGFTWTEIYDPDPGSVMSYGSTANAGLYGAWYYSDEYWRLRNMEYYKI